MIAYVLSGNRLHATGYLMPVESEVLLRERKTMRGPIVVTIDSLWAARLVDDLFGR